MSLRDRARRTTTAVVAAVLVAVLALVARPPHSSAEERQGLAARFAFHSEQLRLPSAAAPSSRPLRDVAPSLRRIEAWVSSVGAGVTLADLSGDGLPNDVCLVDPRSDQVVLSSVAEPPAYQPVALTPPPLVEGYPPTAPMGCRAGDFNEDGRTDLLVYYWGRSPVLFLQPARPVFDPQAFVARELVEPPQVWNTNAVTTGDVDGDGHLDLVVGNYFPDDARVLDPRAHRDPAIQMQDSMSRASNGGRNQVLLWEGGNTGPDPRARFSTAHEAFSDQLATGWTLALGLVDLNGDLLPELYVANDFGNDRLLLNRSQPGTVRFELLEGRRTLSVPASKVLGKDSFKGMGVDFGDLNQDNLLDIVVSNIATDFALHESHYAFVNTGQDDLMYDGVAPFVDHSERLGTARGGWGWDVKFGDFDNSGQVEIVQATGFVRGERNRWPQLHELAMGNDTLLHAPGVWPRFSTGDDLSGHQHNRFYALGPDGRFVDVAPELGLGQPFVTRGVATGDVDGDGRLDFAIANQWEPSYLYRNRCSPCGSFLGLDLVLPLTDEPVRVLPGRRRGEVRARPAVGALVSVNVGGRRQLLHVDGGNGHSGGRDQSVHVGLGDATDAEVTIRYRDRRGTPREAVLMLPAGWHTVVLGTEGGTRP